MSYGMVQGRCVGPENTQIIKQLIKTISNINSKQTNNTTNKS